MGGMQGMQQGQQMMVPMAMPGQQGQQGMPMMMMVMPNGQPMMQGQPQMMQQCPPQQMQQQPVAWAGQQMCQPAPTSDTASNQGSSPKKHDNSGAQKKDATKAKLKNGKLGGTTNTPDQTKVEQPKVEQPKKEPKVETKPEEKDVKLRHELMQRQASEVVQRLRQAGARRAGLGDTAAQLRHSTFSALNLEVSSSSRRNNTAVHPLRRQSLAEFQRELKEAQKKKEAEKKDSMISLPPGSWNKAKTECVSSPSASTRASGEEADVDGLAEFDNLVAA